MNFEKLEKFGLRKGQMSAIVGGLGNNKTATVCSDYSYNRQGQHCDTETETSDDEGILISTKKTGSC